MLDFVSAEMATILDISGTFSFDRDFETSGVRSGCGSAAGAWVASCLIG